MAENWWRIDYASYNTVPYLYKFTASVNIHVLFRKMVWECNCTREVMVCVPPHFFLHVVLFLWPQFLVPLCIGSLHNCCSEVCTFSSIHSHFVTQLQPRTLVIEQVCMCLCAFMHSVLNFWKCDMSGIWIWFVPCWSRKLCALQEYLARKGFVFQQAMQVYVKVCHEFL